MSYLKIDQKEWYKTIDVNLTSVFFMIQSFAKLAIKQKNGNIINISSIGVKLEVLKLHIMQLQNWRLYQ